MFDDSAPIWRFKEELGAVEDPEAARLATNGLHIVEVFPALAWPTWEHRFHTRLGGPRYNPGRRKTFRVEHWSAVVECVRATAARLGVAGIDPWLASAQGIAATRKSDQDLLDAVVCALIGVHWIAQPRSDSILIGDRERGYMVAPASLPVRQRLESAARLRAVPVDAW